MSRPATARLKVNPPLGMLPALQYLLPAQLQIDPSYQRNLETSASQALIRRIAMFWNWDLCQPLVVARREGGELYVIDGQHRLEAARLRGDIAQLPAVVVSYASSADEAASFVHLNQQRRPLTKIDVFKAAVASEDPEANAIADALKMFGLAIPKTTNPDLWKPTELINIGGIEAAWRQFGPLVTKSALQAVAFGFKGQVLRYVGTVFPGIVAVCADEIADGGFGLGGGLRSGQRWERFIHMLTDRSQKDWRADILRYKGDNIGPSYAHCAAAVLRAAWERTNGGSLAAGTMPQRAPSPAPVQFVMPNRDSAAPRSEPAVRFDAEGKTFCTQCDRRVTRGFANACIDRHCKAKARAA